MDLGKLLGSLSIPGFLRGQRQLLVESPCRRHSALLHDIDVAVFNTTTQTINAIVLADSSVSSSNEAILSVEEVSSTIDVDSDFLEPTQDLVPEDGSCSGLAEIQVRAIDLFSVH